VFLRVAERVGGVVLIPRHAEIDERIAALRGIGIDVPGIDRAGIAVAAAPAEIAGEGKAPDGELVEEVVGECVEVGGGADGPAVGEPRA
jgi:hypothetical protein